MERNIRLSVLSLPRILKRVIVMVVDCSLAVFAVWLAYYLRIGDFLPLWDVTDGLYPLPACIVAIVTSLPVFIFFGLYRTILDILAALW